MNIFYFYLTALLATGIYVGRKGGATGRLSVIILIVGVLGSAGLSIITNNLQALQPKMMAWDSLMLLVQLGIAVVSRRTWPMWVAAFQLNTVLAECAVLISSSFQGGFYYAMATLWAMPTLFVMAIGTWRDNKFEVLNNGTYKQIG